MNNMNYADISEEINVKNESVPLAALMDKSTCLAGDALNMVGKINQQMFGLCEPMMTPAELSLLMEEWK